ncbi:MAG: hypothetical protein ACXQTS_05370 [Candidatus Methanospirareceae archaeon]
MTKVEVACLICGKTTEVEVREKESLVTAGKRAGLKTILTIREGEESWGFLCKECVDVIFPKKKGGDCFEV